MTRPRSRQSATPTMSTVESNFDQFNSDTVTDIQNSIDEADGDAPDAETIRDDYEQLRRDYLFDHDDAVEELLTSRVSDENEDDAIGIFYGTSIGDTTIDALEDHHDDVSGDDGAWLNVDVEILRDFDNDHDAVYGSYLVGDDTGQTTLTIFADAASEMGADDVSLQEGDSVHIENAVTEAYNGNISLKATSAAELEQRPEFNPDVPEDSTEFIVRVAELQEKSGLIKRCPEDDCTMVLDGTKCREHGSVDEPEWDLRMKLAVTDGAEDEVYIADQDVTETLTGLTLEEAQEKAMDAADASVVEDELASFIHGRTIRGEVTELGSTNVINEARAVSNAPDVSNLLVEARELKGAMADNADESAA